jgi:hypothetical protein
LRMAYVNLSTRLAERIAEVIPGIGRRSYPATVM